MFKIGEELSSRQVAERLGVSFKGWENNRKKYLSHLEKYYKIELTGYGISRRYVFKEQIQDYEPYISPKDKKAMEKQYQEVILEEISKPNMNLQLYSTMNERVIATGLTGKFGHKKGTSYKYVSGEMKEMFGAEKGDWGTHGKYLDRVWAKQLFDAEYDFERLSEVEERNWQKIIKDNMAVDYMELYSMYENHEISKDEAMFEMFESGWYKYQVAKQTFYELYGFVPVRVKEYLVAPEEAKLHVDTNGFVD